MKTWNKGNVWKQSKGRNETKRRRVRNMAGRRNQYPSLRQLYECLKTGRREDIWLNAKLLTEAEEQCVHTHGVHAEEAMGDEVGSHYQRLGEENHVHQGLCGGIRAHRWAQNWGSYHTNITVSHQYWHPIIVQRWSSLLHRFDSSREEEEREDPCTEKKMN